jgi:hypothetical protein
MRIQSKTDFKDQLDKDFAWRRPELSDVLSSVKTHKGKSKDTALRSAVLVLYAHWEGFIKQAASLYLTYVKEKGLKFKELKDCFVALSIKQKLAIFQQTNKATIHTQLIEYLKSCQEEVAVINDYGAISTKSNLNSDILQQILTRIGLDYSPYELKANLIDAQLLNYRNTIAHGNRLKVTEEEYIIIHNEIIGMMYSIKNDLENAVAIDAFQL